MYEYVFEGPTRSPIPWPNAVLLDIYGPIWQNTAPTIISYNNRKICCTHIHMRTGAICWLKPEPNHARFCPLDQAIQCVPLAREPSDSMAFFAGQFAMQYDRIPTLKTERDYVDCIFFFLLNGWITWDFCSVPFFSLRLCDICVI